MSKVAEAKAARDAAKLKYDNAVKAADAKKDDQALAVAVNEARAEYEAAKDAYTAALETADPLSEDINKAIGNARKQEKDKLYPEIEKLKKQLQDQIAAGGADKNALKATQDQLAAAEKKLKELGGGSGEVTDEKLAELVSKRVMEATAKLEQESVASRMEAQAELNKLKEKLHAKEMETYKKDVIAAANGAIIPELVVGNSKEEIDAALVVAKQAYARVAAQTAKGAAAAEGKAGSELPVVPVSVSSIEGLMGNLTPAQIRAMTPDQWAKHREKFNLK